MNVYELCFKRELLVEVEIKAEAERARVPGEHELPVAGRNHGIPLIEEVADID
jgi:hypothetical protein